MKVQVSLELDEDQRVAIGLLETGRFVAASREEVRSYTRQVVMSSVNAATGIVTKQRDKIATEIRDSLGIEALPKAAEDPIE